MRRLGVTALIAVAAAGLAGAALGAPELARSKAVVRVKSCSLADRTAVFYARMRKVPGTKRMRMRFTLLERPSGLRSFTHVVAPGLGHWRKSAEGVGAYGYRQKVRGLHDGSAYRMRVRYRWYGQDHRLLKSVRRTSHTCRMFVPLPNLRVRLLGHRPTTTPGVWRYGVQVTNGGQVGVDDVGVRFSVDGSVLDTKTIPHLGAGEADSRYFRAPACKDGYSALADPDNAVAELNEGDNEATAACP
jgi:hypothetical protein